MPDAYGEETSLERLASYECPECGPMEEVCATYFIDENMASDVLGGDDNGFTRCPVPGCGEELEMTLEAALDMLDFITERLNQQPPA